VRQAAMQTEIDTAQADADIAGELRATERKKDLAIQQGAVAVEQQEQAARAADKKKDVIQIEAEAAKQKAEIEASAAAEQSKIAAAGEAEAAKTFAAGQAEAIRQKANADAEATKAQAHADADAARVKGLAAAEASKAQGLAEAESIRAKGLAQAESERLLAEARAANDKVNFEIQKIELEQSARIEIARAGATLMAEVGRNARFVDLGGSDKNGNVLFNTLRGVPGLLEQLDVVNRAVSEEGVSFNETIQKTIASLVGPIGDALRKGPAAAEPNAVAEPNAAEPAIAAESAIDSEPAAPLSEEPAAE